MHSINNGRGNGKEDVAGQHESVQTLPACVLFVILQAGYIVKTGLVGEKKKKKLIS